MKKIKHKILFLDHTPFVGGAQLSLLQHIEEIDKNQFTPVIVCSRTAEDIGLTEKYKESKIKYYLVDFNKLKMRNIGSIRNLFVSILQVNNIIKRENIDLIVTNTVRASIVGTFSAIFKRKKIAWFIRDFTFPLMFFRVLSFFPNKIIFNARTVKEYYDNCLITRKSEVVYIGRNFYRKIRLISKDKIKEQRKKWSKSGKEFFVGYIGRLVEWKGPQVLIESMSLLAKSGFKEITCLIIGTGKGQEGDNEEKLKQMVKMANLGKKVFFLGYQKDLTKILPALNLLTLTSIKPEPFSSTIVDAMMARVPVIGTNTGGTSEIIKHRKTGLLVEPNDINGLSEGIKELYNNSGLLREISNNAYNYVMLYNTAEYTTNIIQKIYINTISSE